MNFFGKINSFGYISNYKSCLNDSNILSSKDNYDFIIKELEKNNNGKINKAKLIYRATRDGDSIDNFFNKSNGIKDIILLIKSDNNYIFGGFTKVGFQRAKDKYYKDDAAFVFSFNKKKIYPILKGRNAIRCCYCCCPQFCNNTIYLYSEFLSKNGNFVNGKNDNYEGFSIDYELNNGNKNFKALELEIHQLFFE